MLKKPPLKASFFFDFDSTIYPKESLDEVLHLALSNRKDAHTLAKSIDKICKLGMDGKINILESIKQRIAFANITKNTVQDYITNNTGLQPAVVSGLNALVNLGHDVFLISNGFIDWIAPLCKDLMIDDSKIFANRFAYNTQGLAYLRPEYTPVVHGKHTVINELKKTRRLSPPIIMVGDSITDATTKSYGAADYFIAITAYIKRTGVEKLADATISDIKDFENILTNFLTDRY